MRKTGIFLTGVLLTSLVALLFLLLHGYPVSYELKSDHIVSSKGYGYTYLGPLQPEGFFYDVLGVHRKKDSARQANSSRAELFEDQSQLSGAHSSHEQIFRAGRGMYSDWESAEGIALYFSSSDNSDPRFNGRVYLLRDNLHVGFVQGALGIIIIVIASLVVNLALVMTLLERICELFPLRGFVYAVLCLVFLAFGRWLSGFFFLVSLTVTSALFIATLHELIHVKNRGKAITTVSWTINSIVIIISTGFMLSLAEQTLELLEEGRFDFLYPQSEPIVVDEELGLILPVEKVAEMSRRRRLITLPKEWQQKVVQIPDVHHAVAWHNVVHIHDKNGFRRVGDEFREKNPSVLRILVVGDSFTYGWGIEQEYTYAVQLEQLLRKKYSVEIINLGIPGHQSEDILNTLTSIALKVNPDLVIYGVCHNDFLPSGQGTHYHEYRFPLPEKFKQYLLERSKVAQLVKDAFWSFLIVASIQKDFISEFKGIKIYQDRFEEDARNMAKQVEKNDLPPIVTMVLEKTVFERNEEVTKVAQDLLTNAGLDVIATEEFYKKYSGRTFHISKFEKHPDEEANLIYASMLYRHLTKRPYLEAYRLD